MKNKRFNRYYLLVCIGVWLSSSYPLYMGVRVLVDMLRNGSVMKADYPKYIIPYTPICVALLVGVLLMPLWMKLFKRLGLLAGSVVSLGVFFGVELLLEKNVVVTTELATTELENWQMYMCYVNYRHQSLTPVEVILGDYTPAFKLHFYLIAVLLILAVLNCCYGFGRMFLSGDRTRRKSLVMQAVSVALFLGLCILACFTAFWRDGRLQVSPLSAALMAVFFILMGVVGGLYVGSFLLKKRRLWSVVLPACVASGLALLMYVGELILLDGLLYRFGSGFFFAGLPGIVLAPVDLLIVLTAGGVTALVMRGCALDEL